MQFVEHFIYNKAILNHQRFFLSRNFSFAWILPFCSICFYFLLMKSMSPWELFITSTTPTRQWSSQCQPNELWTTYESQPRSQPCCWKRTVSSSRRRFRMQQATYAATEWPMEQVHFCWVRKEYPIMPKIVFLMLPVGFGKRLWVLFAWIVLDIFLINCLVSLITRVILCKRFTLLHYFVRIFPRIFSSIYSTFWYTVYDIHCTAEFPCAFCFDDQEVNFY